VLNFVEDALDGVALARGRSHAAAKSNDWGDLPVGEGFHEGIEVVGLVTNQRRRIGISGNGFAQVRSLTGSCESINPTGLPNASMSA
jgi:hypothetical protein